MNLAFVEILILNFACFWEVSMEKEKEFSLESNIIKKNSSGSLKKTLSGHSSTVWALAVLKNGDLASGSSDTTIMIWQSLTGTLKKTLKGHSDVVLSLAVLQNGDLASGSYDYTVKIWDLKKFGH